ncbi:MAG: chaperonin cofactor prefoldin [Francisellaceae bacterium]|jgi:chaperonin cofactor prefoldin
MSEAVDKKVTWNEIKELKVKLETLTEKRDSITEEIKALKQSLSEKKALVK